MPMYIIGLYGVVSHVLLLIAFIKDPLKCFKNSATYLVANLAVSDLLISLFEPYKKYVSSETRNVYNFLVHLYLTVAIILVTSILQQPHSD
ncbi:uncharacterized protein LOC114539332 [Dendronephthya gigantea]|uniref:uncharacterized protein LOC114539332 n=1 Tax=Dendronephthya gigantea TaxID=151771 RepID=UPI0010695C1A|nr:uncharacterized protein LOC114539332 [Dendronephthya gigantea]